MHVTFPACVTALLCAAPLGAQKADTVVLRNGDRIIGEIKNLDRDALSYSTDDMGTLSIKWDKIDRIMSGRYFEVELVSGRRYYGALQRSIGLGQVVVVVREFHDTLDKATIVRINPIGSSFLTRVDGHVNLGLTFQRANRVRDFNVDADAKHRSQKWLTELRTSVYFEAQEGAQSTSRNSVGLSGVRFLPGRWLVLASGQLEQNAELDLALRSLVTAAGGRFLVQTNRGSFLLGGGLTYTNEHFTGTAPAASLEGVVSLGAEYYRRDTPKSDIQAKLSVYPSVTDFGRVRTDLDVSISHEFFKDLTTGVSLFDKFDSRPPTGAATHDFGVTLTTGWAF